MTIKEIFEKFGIGTKFRSGNRPIHTIIGTWKDGVLCTTEFPCEDYPVLKVSFDPEYNDYEVVNKE